MAMWESLGVRTRSLAMLFWTCTKPKFDQRLLVKKQSWPWWSRNFRNEVCEKTNSEEKTTASQLAYSQFTAKQKPKSFICRSPVSLPMKYSWRILCFISSYLINLLVSQSTTHATLKHSKPTGDQIYLQQIYCIVCTPHHVFLKSTSNSLNSKIIWLMGNHPITWDRHHQHRVHGLLPVGSANSCSPSRRNWWLHWD